MKNNEFDALKQVDVYSMILFALYKLKETPDYSTLSELAYVLDEKSLFKFLEYFGGLTITVPKLEDFKLICKALILYQRVNLEGQSLNKELKAISEKGLYKIDAVRHAYEVVCEVLLNYEFSRD